MVAQRTKEIGIRKVVGATAADILALLTKDFVKLVFVAGLVALPLAYFCLNRWLQGYAFRIDLGWWLLAVPMLCVLLITLVVVSLHTVKAARANPVDALRYE
ncbi:MAG: FtsX-like permease family protein [Bacteroidetes bacterium]|nr:FtsX-like permease family protein [Bacteroidota bacterium]